MLSDIVAPLGTGDSARFDVNIAPTGVNARYMLSDPAGQQVDLANKAFDFNGNPNGGVTISNSTALFSLRNNFTVTAWMKPESLDGERPIIAGNWQFGLQDEKLWFGIGTPYSTDYTPPVGE